MSTWKNKRFYSVESTDGLLKYVHQQGLEIQNKKNNTKEPSKTVIIDTKIIANINGTNIEEYCQMAEITSKADVDSLMKRVGLWEDKDNNED